MVSVTTPLGTFFTEILKVSTSFTMVLDLGPIFLTIFLAGVSAIESSAAPFSAFLTAGMVLDFGPTFFLIFLAAGVGLASLLSTSMTSSSLSAITSIISSLSAIFQLMMPTDALSQTSSLPLFSCSSVYRKEGVRVYYERNCKEGEGELGFSGLLFLALFVWLFGKWCSFS